MRLSDITTARFGPACHFTLVQGCTYGGVAERRGGGVSARPAPRPRFTAKRQRPANSGSVP